MAIIIPAAGLGSRFAEKGYKPPKPLIEARGVPMIQLVRDMFPYDEKVVVLTRNEYVCDIEKLGIADYVLPVEKTTQGAALTVLCAEGVIQDWEAVFVCNSDNIFHPTHLRNFSKSIQPQHSGAILTFRVNGGPWSYARTGYSGDIVEVAEKRPISNLATAGLYYFKTWDIFRKAAYQMVVADDRTKNEFYLCPVYNYIIRNGGIVHNHTMPSDAFISLGTPEDLERYNAN